MRNHAAPGQEHIQDFLSGYCFGDFYTRKFLDLKDRELVTLSILISLGGVDDQVAAHIQGNLNLGNDKGLLVKIITHLVPYVGFPKALNALKLLNQTR